MPTLVRAPLSHPSTAHATDRAEHARRSTLFRSQLIRFGRLLIDTLFPMLCLGCGSEGSYLCERCLARVPEMENQACPICHKPYQAAGVTCRKCSPHTALSGLLVAAPYRARLVERVIHTFKYRFIESLAAPLAIIVGQAIARAPLPLPDFLIPVPLHPRRLRFRGFNQAELLAKAIASDLAPGLGITVTTGVLERCRFTKPQMQTRSAEERRMNLTNAFQIQAANRTLLAGKSIWLIDDVATTGTTLEECAKTLKAAGAKSVWGIVIAR